MQKQIFPTFPTFSQFSHSLSKGDEMANTEEMDMEEEIQLTEKVLLDKKILGHILANLPKEDLKKIRRVNSVWRSTASAQIRIKQQNFYLITTSENLQKFVDFWNGRTDNIPYKNFAISLQHNYPSHILQLFWETIAHIVTNLQISYGETDKSLISLNKQSSLSYPSLKHLKLSMLNICKQESLATCTNLLFGLLQTSPKLKTFSVVVFGDYRSITLSDYFVDSLKNRDNKNLKELHIKGLDIVDHHFASLAEIPNLSLAELSLDIPRFEDSKLTGEGLINFLLSQSDTLKILNIIDLTGVFDLFEFPRLQNLSCLEVQRWMPTGRHNPQYIDNGIDYHSKLPNLTYVRFGFQGQYPYGLQKFLPCTKGQRVTSVNSLQVEMGGFVIESDVIKAQDRFRNLKWLHIPAWYRPLMEVYKTQESLETLILDQGHIYGVPALDKMLTGLEPREQIILRSIPGLLDKLTLNCDNVEETGLASIGCLKKLRKLRFLPACGAWRTDTNLPSLLTFKLVLTRMKSLEEIDCGKGKKLPMKDLPEDRALLNSDILTNIKGENKARMTVAGSIGADISSQSPVGPSIFTPYPPPPPFYSPTLPNYLIPPLDRLAIPQYLEPLPPLPLSGSGVLDSLAANSRRLCELLAPDMMRATTSTTPPPKRPAPE